MEITAIIAGLLTALIGLISGLLNLYRSWGETLIQKKANSRSLHYDEKYFNVDWIREAAEEQKIGVPRS